MKIEQAVETAEELQKMTDRLRILARRFDNRSAKCVSCGLQHASNLSESKAVEQLNAAIGRLEKVVSYLGDSLDRTEGKTA